MYRVSYQKHKNIYLDFIVIVVSYLCIFMSSNLAGLDLSQSLLNAALLIGFCPIVFLIINYMPSKNEDTYQIYKNKMAIIPFIIIELATIMILFISRRYLGTYTGSSSQAFRSFILISLKIFLSSTILISYLFKIKLKFFYWKISLKDIVLIMVIYILIRLSMNIHLIINGSIHLQSLANLSTIIKFTTQLIRQSLYPALFEELLYRGLLISGLKGFGFKDEHTNIIQAVIFGVSHVISFGNASLISLLHTATQVIMGYIFGKVYFKTKSLSPCILLHGLIDIII